jgi:hypothetical protein
MLYQTLPVNQSFLKCGFAKTALSAANGAGEKPSETAAIIGIGARIIVNRQAMH